MMTSKYTNVIRNVDTSGLNFRLVDAKGLVVGRLASQLAIVLQGKDKPTYAPHEDSGDVVVVINARHVELTGRRWEKKIYKWHTGYPGGLKERSAERVHELDPGDVLRRAVNGMLPKNLLRKPRDRKLRIFPDADHPFQNHPQLLHWQMPPRKLRVKEPLFVLDPGSEPMNPVAYLRRYGHQLDEPTRQRVEAMIARNEAE